MAQLMNSISLSVRSIAVDFMVSLLGSTFEENGTIDEITLVLLTVLPEVVAREIAMYCASGQIRTMADVECVLWPLRRALADVEEASPVDDNRVDAQLVPFLATLCRSCQAIIDGVFIELRLQGDVCEIMGTEVSNRSSKERFTNHGKGRNKRVDDGHHAISWVHAFDADEESVFEASNSFLPETAPMQRLRWLLTLKNLHEAKGQWVEAAETLRLCARSIADAIPHLKSVWRPSRFKNWRDERVSLWIPSIGAGLGDKNDEVMAFADNFLEPGDVFADIFSSHSSSGKLQQPTVEIMCSLLTKVSKEAVQKYLEEGGVESLAFLRLEELVKSVMDVVESMCAIGTKGGKVYRGDTDVDRRLVVEENAALRKMSAILNGEMSKIAERILFVSEESHTSVEKHGMLNSPWKMPSNEKAATVQRSRQYYVRLILLGKQPNRFMESTSLPTFLEWGMPSICRVPKKAVLRALQERSNKPLEDRICACFAEPLLRALAQEIPEDCIVLCDQPPTEADLLRFGDAKTYVIVTVLHMAASTMVHRSGESEFSDLTMAGGSKRFFFRSKVPVSPKLESSGSAASGKLAITPSFVESMVGQRFPCALSRQRAIITSEYISGAMDGDLYKC